MAGLERELRGPGTSPQESAQIRSFFSHSPTSSVAPCGVLPILACWGLVTLNYHGGCMDPARVAHLYAKLNKRSLHRG